MKTMDFRKHIIILTGLPHTVQYMNKILFRLNYCTILTQKRLCFTGLDQFFLSQNGQFEAFIFYLFS